MDDNTIVVAFQDNETQCKMLETIRGNLGSWRRLLQLMGGDIDLSKSKWSTMRWKYDKDWGQAQLETIKEFPGEVGMISMRGGQENKQVLGRLEAYEAERVLGVRLPLGRKHEIRIRVQMQADTTI